MGPPRGPRRRDARLDAHYHAAPLPIAVQVAPTRCPPPWSGPGSRSPARMPRAPPVLVRNRPYEGAYGYEVLSPGPRRRPDPPRRPWLGAQREERRETRPEVPPNPAGEVTVTGWLRPGGASLGHHLPAGQLASINIARGSGQLDGTDLLGSLRLCRRSSGWRDGHTPPAPCRWSAGHRTSAPTRPTRSSGGWARWPGFILVFFGVRREYRDGLEAESREPARRPRKVRIWDEEDA